MQRGDEQALELLLDRVAGELVEQAGQVLADLVIRREQAEIFVDAARLGVVVAGADVAIVAQHAALVAHDERELAVGLEPDHPVDDVHSRFLELARPVDVRRLVEAGLDLNEREHRLACLGCGDERLDDRAVAARAVEGLLDRENIGVAGSLFEKRLHARRERLVRVMQQDVAARDRRERVGFGVGLDREQGRARRRDVLAVLEFGPVDAEHLEEPAEVERRRQPVHLLLGDSELPHEQFTRSVVHVVGDLKADGRAEPSTQELALERLDEVLGLVLVDLDVFVAGHPELVVLEDLHAGEELLEMVRDEVLERDESQEAALVIRKLHEAWQHGRHLEPRELLLAGLRAAHPDREVEGEAGDVGEGVGWVDGERHEHGEDLGREDLVDASAVVLVEIGPGLDVDAGVVKLRLHEIAKRGGVPGLELLGALADRVKRVEGCRAHVRRDGETGHDAPLEARDADHEELV